MTQAPHAEAGRVTLLLAYLLCIPAIAELPPQGTAAALPESAETAAANPCAGDPNAGGIDAMRAGIQRGVCSTARLVDRLFSGEHEYAESEADNSGRAGLALGWREGEGVDLDGRFRANLSLPAFHERLNATIGRASADDFIADDAETFESIGGSFSDDQQAEWYAGLGYNLQRDRDSRFDLGAGVKLELPLNPYVNARYRRYFYPTTRTLITLRTTGFWENHEGFGVTQAADVDRVLSDDYLLRLGSSVRLSEATLGALWRSRLALYQALGRNRYLRYEISARGETDGEQPDLYGFRLTHRRAVWRDWFFIEAGATLFWARSSSISDRCDACLGASLGFEFLFGEAYDAALLRQRGGPGGAVPDEPTPQSGP